GQRPPWDEARVSAKRRKLWKIAARPPLVLELRFFCPGRSSRAARTRRRRPLIFRGFVGTPLGKLFGGPILSTAGPRPLR
ncbi:hypothetical protein KUCAC02_025012, partial [Chaenocephalus aceratus]